MEEHDAPRDGPECTERVSERVVVDGSLSMQWDRGADAWRSRSWKAAHLWRVLNDLVPQIQEQFIEAVHERVQ